MRIECVSNPHLRRVAMVPTLALVVSGVSAAGAVANDLPAEPAAEVLAASRGVTIVSFAPTRACARLAPCRRTTSPTCPPRPSRPAPRR
ncbi:hypothetical protein GCM10010972_14280 [Cellulomonas carbonis]|nr:hypothetical protein GCM10010972_14280 [Cellulomonas carbonis]